MLCNISGIWNWIGPAWVGKSTSYPIGYHEGSFCPPGCSRRITGATWRETADARKVVHCIVTEEKKYTKIETIFITNWLDHGGLYFIFFTFCEFPTKLWIIFTIRRKVGLVLLLNMSHVLGPISSTCQLVGCGRWAVEWLMDILCPQWIYHLVLAAPSCVHPYLAKAWWDSTWYLHPVPSTYVPLSPTATPVRIRDFLMDYAHLLTLELFQRTVSRLPPKG